MSFRDRSWGKILIGVCCLTLGLGCLAFVASSLSKDISLWVWGRRVKAEVVDLWTERTSKDGAQVLTFQYFVRYQFTTSDGQVVIETSPIGAGEWAGIVQVGHAHDTVDIYGNVILASPPIFRDHAYTPAFTHGELQKGDLMDVVYFPPYPAHNRLDDSHLVPVLACAYVPLLLVGLLGLIGGWRLLRPATLAVSETRSYREILSRH